MLRRALLALVFIGAGGLVLELLLLEHFESVLQFIPLVLLAAVLVSATLLARRPSVQTIQLFRAVMALCVVAGVVGVFLHYRGNVEFELERQPLRHGLDLFWKAIRGATPALAPGALSQLGLLGLVYTFRHPALRGAPPMSMEGSNVHNTERT
jgi:branched-subunit amino acid transport protein